jgi:transposase
MGGMIPGRSVHAEIVFAGVPLSRDRVVPVGRPRDVANELGVSGATVYRWIAQDEIDLGQRSGVRSGERAELSEARARIRELEAELELTHKAAAIFEAQQGRRVVRPKGSTR